VRGESRQPQRVRDSTVIAEPDRVYSTIILRLYKEDLSWYGRTRSGMCAGTRRLAEVAAPTEFLHFRRRWCRCGFQSVAVTGSGEKINSILSGRISPARAGSRAPAGIAALRGRGYNWEMLGRATSSSADVESPEHHAEPRDRSLSDTLHLFLPPLKEPTRWIN